MTESKAIRRYTRAVSRELCCSKSTRRRLLDGLRQELEEYAGLDYERLCDEFGMPAQTAAQLMDTILENEVRSARRTKHIRFTAIIVVLVMLIVCVGGYALDKYMKYGKSGTFVVVVEDIKTW
ncbi:MAG: hypothetical protein Q4C72_04865 [Eubacteriales bacterium]|nr:hypothetical protein [Eubacteriales bacterium]